MKTCAPPNTYIIDFFYPGEYSYLAVINVNTRKGYVCVPSVIAKAIELNNPLPTKNIKTAESVKEMIKGLINNDVNIKHILCDKEKAFDGTIKNKNKNPFMSFLRKHNISIRNYQLNHIPGNATRMNHSTIRIVDRFVRTIRDMIYLIDPASDYSPDIINYVVDCYNNTPHSIFKEMLHIDISPNEIDDNKALENEFVRECVRYNLLLNTSDDFAINIHTPYRIYNESDPQEKRRTKLLPGIYKWSGKMNHYEDKLTGKTKYGALYEMKSNKGQVMYVPRWMLVNVAR